MAKKTYRVREGALGRWWELRQGHVTHYNENTSSLAAESSRLAHDHDIDRYNYMQNIIDTNLSTAIWMNMWQGPHGAWHNKVTDRFIETDFKTEGYYRHKTDGTDLTVVQPDTSHPHTKIPWQCLKIWRNDLQRCCCIIRFISFAIHRNCRGCLTWYSNSEIMKINQFHFQLLHSFYWFTSFYALKV